MPSAIANKSNNPTITIILAAAHHRTMPHRRVFAPLREPLRHDPQLQLQPDQVRGACPFLNPTHAIFMPIIEAPQTEPPVAKEQQQQQGPSRAAHPNQIRYLWRSRDNRKGRHALQVQHHALYALPRNTNGLRAVLAGLWRMATVFPYWDVSYLVAFIFTLGSVIWVINAFFVWLPLEDPSSEFSNESSTAGGVTAFVGATVFEIGSILLVLEAVNENSAGCFGWALERVLRDQADELLDVLQPDNHACQHHHVNRRAFLSGRQQAITTSGRTFTWLPSWNELRTHYMRELGFLASMAQLIGATIFWISGFTCLPGIINHMSQGLTDGVFWVPQIVGGSLFVISGLLFTIETQKKWYIPAPHVLGWHIGIWNFIGGIGFTLCGSLGPASANSGVDYESTLATFWGSWAFLIGSIIQWYESLDKYPVETKKQNFRS